jgi:hypothetical protein
MRCILTGESKGPVRGKGVCQCQGELKGSLEESVSVLERTRRVVYELNNHENQWSCVR